MKKLVSRITLILCLAWMASACEPQQTLPPPPTTEPVVPTSSPVPTVPPPQRINPQAMAQMLADAEIAEYDPLDWLIQHGRLDPSTPRMLSEPPSYTIGEVRELAYAGMVEAELRLITDLLYVWVEVGFEIDPDVLAAAAERFETEIYPVMHDYFGSEWSPGVDNDPHIAILHVRGGHRDPGVFFWADEYVTQVDQPSNAQEILYVNLDQVAVGEDSYFAALIAAFQQMIQWNNKGPEDFGVAKGLSQLAVQLLGFETAAERAFLRQSRVSLTDWPLLEAQFPPYLGADYLFSLYLWERLGDDFLRQWSRHPSAGLLSVNKTLAEQGIDVTVDDLFADWIVANYLDAPTLADGHYGYRSKVLPSVCPRKRVTSLPLQETYWLPQYAADYIEINGQGTVTLNFRGRTETVLIPTEAHSGHSFWWSNRGDSAMMTLTRSFDLSGLEAATLQFWMWYDIQPAREEFVCVTVSADDGETWAVLSGDTSDQDGSSLCYGGISGGGEVSQWVQEQVDLSPYAGQEILVRFEYVTDDFSSRPGFAVDDLSVPELGYEDDVEEDTGEWEAVGFVRTSNAVPQNWALWLVRDGEVPEVQRLEIAGDGTAQAEIPLAGVDDRIVLIVGAMAPVTQQEAYYELEMTGDLTGAVPPPPVEGTLFQDDFEDVCSGWASYDEARVAEGYTNGAYFLEVKVPDGFWWSLVGQDVREPEQDLANVIIDVDTIQEIPAVDNSWGVLCRFQDENNYYAFDIGNDGFYAITAMLEGEFYFLHRWTASSAINQGPGASNHLTVACQGETLRLAVNDQLVAEVQHDALTDGGVGLSSSTFAQGGARVLFDNLVVRKP